MERRVNRDFVHEDIDTMREENAALRAELEEARETLAAIRTGAVDALLVDTPEGQRVYTLEGAEHVYRTLIEEMQEGAVILNAEDTIHYCNRRFAQMVHRPLEEVMGQPFTEYLATSDRRLWSELPAGGAGNIELELRSARGRRTPVAISMVNAAAGAAQERRLILTDLTERKRFEAGIVQLNAELEQRIADRTAKLTESLQQNELFATLIRMSSLPLGIGLLDGGLGLVNRAFEDLTGYSGDELRSINWASTLTPPEWRDSEYAILSELQRTGKPVRYEKEYIRKDGTRVPVELFVHLMRDAEGRPKCYYAFVTDITERKRIQQELKDADRRKDEFLAILSHELRNPLAPIRTAAHALAAPTLAPQQLLWAQGVIQRQVQNMASLLDDLLDIARITQGKLELKRERVELSEIFDSAVESARPLIDRKSHQLLVTLPPTRLVLHVDALRVSQVVANLLTNAAKYTDPGGRIDLSGRLVDGALVITVTDNGIGLSADALGRIFTMFSQVSDTAARAEGGLGIGLALVKGLTSLHGGTVEAKSRGAGCGSEFVIRLPLPAELPDLVTRDIDDSAALRTIGRRVLVADDNRDAADSLAMLLELSGHESRVAHSGPAALTLAATFRPDVVVLDIGMPGMDGYELARTLRREPGGDALCLIALTGWGQDADKARARDAGFNHHLTKPVDPRVLGELIADWRSRATH